MNEPVGRLLATKTITVEALQRDLAASREENASLRAQLADSQNTLVARFAVINVSQLARALMVSPDTVREMLRRGELPTPDLGTGGRSEFRWFVPTIERWQAGEELRRGLPGVSTGLAKTRKKQAQNQPKKGASDGKEE